MDFNNELNLILAKLALGENLGLFDLNNVDHNRMVSFAVRAYLSGMFADSIKNSISQKLSNPNYDFEGLLKPEFILSDNERRNLMGLDNGSIKSDIEANYDIKTDIEVNYDIKTEPKRHF